MKHKILNELINITDDDNFCEWQWSDGTSFQLLVCGTQSYDRCHQDSLHSLFGSHKICLPCLIFYPASSSLMTNDCYYSFEVLQCHKPPNENCWQLSFVLAYHDGAMHSQSQINFSPSVQLAVYALAVIINHSFLFWLMVIASQQTFHTFKIKSPVKSLPREQQNLPLGSDKSQPCWTNKQDVSLSLSVSYTQCLESVPAWLVVCPSWRMPSQRKDAKLNLTSCTNERVLN